MSIVTLVHILTRLIVVLKSFVADAAVRSRGVEALPRTARIQQEALVNIFQKDENVISK